MRSSLSQPILVENKPGAGGNVGTRVVVKSAPDGYTILFGSSGPLLINSSLYRNAGFDPIKDFSPLAYIGEIPNVLVVNSSLPVHTLKDLVEYAKTHAGLSYGSSGSGSTNHLAGAMFSRSLNKDIIHVPYKGTAPALNDLLGGQITMMYIDVLTAAPHVKSGRLRALGAASVQRSKVLPDVPTFREQGVPSLDLGVAFGIVGPAGLPNEIVERLAAAIQSAIRSPETQEAFARQGVETSPINSPQQFGDYIRISVDNWREVVKLTGASLE
jgi:tripartite-type tricarboxylate transporter receptor subunit TctC